MNEIAKQLYSNQHLCFRCRKFRPENGPNNCNTAKQILHVCDEFEVAAPIIHCEQFTTVFIPIHGKEDYMQE